MKEVEQENHDDIRIPTESESERTEGMGEMKGKEMQGRLQLLRES
jgi:hypothetical protein